MKGACSEEKFCYVPFGAGRHRCIGEAFAYVQIKTIWSTLLRVYEFELVDGRFPPVNTATMIHTPKQPIIRYHKRAVWTWSYCQLKAYVLLDGSTFMYYWSLLELPLPHRLGLKVLVCDKICLNLLFVCQCIEWTETMHLQFDKSTKLCPPLVHCQSITLMHHRLDFQKVLWQS